MLGINREKVINKVILVDAYTIKTNPAQPRKVFDKDNLDILATSIKENGLLQPITVRKNFKNEYEIISGERRFRACKQLGFQQIPVICVEKTDSQSAILAIIENIHRTDLNIFEQADALKALIIEWNVTQEEAALKLQIAQSTLANKLRLLKLPEKIKYKIIEYNLSERHARALLKIHDEEKAIEAIEHIYTKELTVAQTDKYIDDLLKQKQQKNFVPIIKDVRVFINSINKAIKVMKKAGIPATSEKKQEENYIEYTVRIPLKSV